MHEENSPNFSAKRPLPRAIWGIIGAFFLLCTLLQFIILLDFGPDEPWHLEYVHYLANEGRLPTPEETHIVQHPPLYYVAMAVIWKATGVQQRPRSLPPGITSYDKFEPNAILARRLIRLCSALLGCVTLFFMARTLAVLGVPQGWQIFLVAWAAAWPMLQYVSAVTNNENLSYAYSAFLCFVLVSRLKEGICTPRQALTIGLLCGATTLIKQTTMFAIPLALWTLWTTGERQQRRRRIGVFAAGVFATGIWWPLFNILRAGEPFPTFTPHPDQPTWQVLISDWNVIVFQWLRVLLETTFLPDWSLMFVPRAFETVVALGGVAIIIALFVWGTRRKENQLLSQLRAMSFTAMVLLLLGVLQYCMFKDQRAQLGGRYLLNSLPWAIVFLAACLPLWNQRADENANSLDVKPPGLAVVILLGFILLVDAAWWFIVWTHYDTSIATELQRRAVGQ